jgi:hypothetical protein
MMNVVPISAQQPTQQGEATCPNCGAAIVADQRYCLSCGQPCSPLRLEFLDVLLADPGSRGSGIGGGEQTATTVLPAPAGYVPAYLPPVEPDGAIGWLRRYSGLLALVGVLFVTGLIGLLIGHWTKGASAPSGPQVVKIEGALPLAAAAGNASTVGTPTTTTPTSGSAAGAPQSKAQEEKEVKETEASTVKAPPPAKASAGQLNKLAKSTGKAHKKEIEALTAGGKPIVTGG